MDDLIIVLQKPTLEDMGSEAHDAELNAKLKALETDAGRNFAVFERGMFVPEAGISILPSPAVPPDGACKICDGELMVAGEKITVEAFRMSAGDVEAEEAVADMADEPLAAPHMTGETDEPPI